MLSNKLHTGLGTGHHQFSTTTPDTPDTSPSSGEHIPPSPPQPQTMPPKNIKPTSDELLAQFDDLGVDAKPNAQQPASKTTGTTRAATSANTNNANANANARTDTNTKTTTGQSEQDILAELDNLASQRPASGPGTPRLSSAEPRSSTRSPRPTPSTGRTSEDRLPVRKSGESGRSSRTGNRNAATPSSSERPAATGEEEAQGGAGGGWWGGIFATASAAMKQAEAAVKEIQQNEEAQKWAQQVKGNVGALKEIGNKSIPYCR